jgi:hypothetical protein
VARLTVPARERCDHDLGIAAASRCLSASSMPISRENLFPDVYAARFCAAVSVL